MSYFFFDLYSIRIIKAIAMGFYSNVNKKHLLRKLGYVCVFINYIVINLGFIYYVIMCYY